MHVKSVKQVTFLLLVAALVVVGLLGSLGSVGASTTPPPSDGGVIPDPIEGNPTCDGVGCGTYSFKFDNITEGGYQDGVPYRQYFGSTLYIEIVLSDGLKSVAWTSNFPIDCVLVKGGLDAYKYTYSGAMADSGLRAPQNPGEQIPQISHVTFCFTPRLVVSKDAETSFTRTWKWDIDKKGSETYLLLTKWQKFEVSYDVKVSATHKDSDWKVKGEIKIENPWGEPAIIASVTDVISPDIAADVTCPAIVSFPHTLPAGDALTCTYKADLPDGTDRVNTATVTTSGVVKGGVGTADVKFGDPTTKVDECVEVWDDKGDPANPIKLGDVCAADAPKTFSYKLWIGPFDCGDSIFKNVAWLITSDSKTKEYAYWEIRIKVDCPVGCTLTQGYWKTHSEFGPAPYDATWAKLPSGASTIFFLSNQTYHEVLWTPPAGGNAYYSLAHQYIAAELNKLAGAASTPEVDAALSSSKTLFETYTPDQIAALKGNDALRQQFIALADTLDKYNNGLIGPGHCSE